MSPHRKRTKTESLKLKLIKAVHVHPVATINVIKCFSFILPPQGVIIPGRSGWQLVIYLAQVRLPLANLIAS